MKNKFYYLIRIRVGAQNFSILVQNIRQTPTILIETIAKEKISQYINKNYSKLKEYRTQTSEQFFNKMIKGSDFEIEDLNQLELYDLNLKFEHKSDNIKNDINEKNETIIIGSKINDEFVG